MKIYIASKLRHKEKWHLYRTLYPRIKITSSWIDTAPPEGEDLTQPSAVLAEAWVSNLREVTSSDKLLLYHEKGEQQQGAMLETGCAINAGLAIHLVTNAWEEINSWKYHPSVRFEYNLDTFFDRINPCP